MNLTIPAILTRQRHKEVLMVSIYATLIINGRRTFDSVPKKLQAKVEAELKNRGYGTDGQPLPVEEKTKED